jgi:hypothetical protein
MIGIARLVHEQVAVIRRFRFAWKLAVLLVVLAVAAHWFSSSVASNQSGSGASKSNMPIVVVLFLLKRLLCLEYVLGGGIR